VAHLDTGRTWRGGQAQVLWLMRGLAARGHAGLLLAPDGPLAERAREAGLPVVRWRPRGELDPLAVVAAARELSRFGADVAHAHSAHAHATGVPAARLARVPAVVVSRRVDFDVATHPFSRLKYALPVDRYLCISRGVMEVMRRAGVPERRLALVPSGVEPPRPARGRSRTADLRRLIGAPPEAPVVGTVAALAPHKDHATLLEAVPALLARVPGARFAWVGEGECRGALERRVAALGLGEVVRLLGFRADATALLEQFTVFALSSHLEGLCTSLIDAQALGVPIVATRAGGIPDVVEDGVSGRLVPPRDPPALAAALAEALLDPEARRAWAAAGRRSAERFTADRMVEGTLEAYADVLRERGRRT
jgi:glycosyltransferase involved in cell wall biosynthesis